MFFCRLSLKRVDLVGTMISDDGVRKLVRGSPRLEWLGLAECENITARSLEHVAANLQHLEGIDLHADEEESGPRNEVYYAVSEGVEQLLRMRRLHRIWLLLTSQSELCQFVASRRPFVETRGVQYYTRLLHELE